MMDSTEATTRIVEAILAGSNAPVTYRGPSDESIEDMLKAVGKNVGALYAAVYQAVVKA